MVNLHGSKQHSDLNRYRRQRCPIHTIRLTSHRKQRSARVTQQYLSQHHDIVEVVLEVLAVRLWGNTTAAPANDPCGAAPWSHISPTPAEALHICSQRRSLHTLHRRTVPQQLHISSSPDKIALKGCADLDMSALPWLWYMHESSI